MPDPTPDQNTATFLRELAKTFKEVDERQREELNKTIEDAVTKVKIELPFDVAERLPRHHQALADIIQFLEVRAKLLLNENPLV